MVDLQQMEERDVQGSVIVQVTVKTLRHALGDLRPYLVEILQSVSGLPMDEKHRTFLEQLLKYIIEGCKNIEEQDVEQAFQLIGSRHVREAYMTLAERLIEKGKAEGKREGKVAGEREGEEQGRLKDKREILLKLISQKFGSVADADKRKIMGTRNPDKLDRAIGLILNSESIAEVLQPLD